MERTPKLVLGGAAVAVVAFGVAWIAGVFDRSDAPEGAIADDSVTITVGEQGLLEQLTSPAILGVGIIIVAIATAGIWVRKRRGQERSAPGDRRRHG